MTNTELRARTAPESYDGAQPLAQTDADSIENQNGVSRPQQAVPDQQGAFFGSGVLDIIADGFGFLHGELFLPGPLDVYVSAYPYRRFNIRPSDLTTDLIRLLNDHEQYTTLTR